MSNIPLTEHEAKLNAQRAKERERYQRRKEYFLQRRANNRDKLNEYRRQYRKTHLPEAAEYARQQRAKNGATPRVRTRTGAVKLVTVPAEKLTLDQLKSRFLKWREKRAA